MSTTTHSESIAALLKSYGEGPDILLASVAGLSNTQLRSRPAPESNAGLWSIHEVICHLNDFEIINTERIKRILAEEGPTLMDADPDGYTNSGAYEARDTAEELTLFGALRKHLLAIVHTLSPEKFSRIGNHSVDGPLTLETFLRRTTRHVLHHLPFIEAKRKALGAESIAKPPRELSTHTATIRWQLDGPDFRRGKYSRLHTWSFDGGAEVAASPSPHVVPAPWSATAPVDPEEALVASIASCHMLTFLYLASKAGYTCHRYVDHASGVMTRNDAGVPWVSRVSLRPEIDWSETIPTAEAIANLHAEAHHQCFIANSVKTEIVVAH